MDREKRKRLAELSLERNRLNYAMQQAKSAFDIWNDIFGDEYDALERDREEEGEGGPRF